MNHVSAVAASTHVQSFSTASPVPNTGRPLIRDARVRPREEEGPLPCVAQGPLPCVAGELGPCVNVASAWLLSGGGGTIITTAMVTSIMGITSIITMAENIVSKPPLGAHAPIHEDKVPPQFRLVLDTGAPIAPTDVPSKRCGRMARARISRSCRAVASRKPRPSARTARVRGLHTRRTKRTGRVLRGASHGKVTITVTTMRAQHSFTS